MRRWSDGEQDAVRASLEEPIEHSASPSGPLGDCVEERPDRAGIASGTSARTSSTVDLAAVESVERRACSSSPTASWPWLAAIDVPSRTKAADPRASSSAAPRAEPDAALLGARRDPAGHRAAVGGAELADLAAGRRDGLDERSGVVEALADGRSIELEEGEGVARGDRARGPRPARRASPPSGRAGAGRATTTSVPPPKNVAVATRSAIVARRRRRRRSSASARAATPMPRPARPRADGRRGPFEPVVVVAPVVAEAAPGRCAEPPLAEVAVIGPSRAAAIAAAGPGQPADVVRRDPGRPADVGLEARRAAAERPRPGPVASQLGDVRVAARPRGEPGAPSARGAGRPACRRRPRSAPRASRRPTSAANASPSASRVTG